MNGERQQTVVLVSADDAFANSATNTLLPQYQVVRAQPAVDEIQRLVTSCDPDVCIIDIDQVSWDQQYDMGVISAVRALTDQLPIIFATYDMSAATLVPAMRAGANDVCDKDFTADELLAQVDRHLTRRGARLGREAARLFTFLGSRDGIGTTTTALAVTEMLAARAEESQRILLLDFSHPPAEIPDLVGARATYFMTDAIHDLARLDETMIDGALLHAWYPNLCVLPLANSERGITTVSIDDLIKLITVLKTYFHAVVADTNWCWRAELATRLFLSADTAFLCCAQSITSIHGATAFLDQVRETSARDFTYRILLTRYDAALKPGPPEIQKAMGATRPPLTVPEDRRHVELTRNAGEPLTRNTRSAFSKAIALLVGEMFDTNSGTGEAHARSAPNLLSRLARLRAGPPSAAE